MSTLPENPNFIIFMTDQQRTIQDFPSDWVSKNLPNYSKFLAEGASFPENICNSSPCGPSRASIFSGMFPSNNGVTSNFGTVSPDQMNFANILNDNNYDVHYMGKLHMLKDFTCYSKKWTEEPSSAPATALDENELLKNSYGIHSWTSPDFGTNLVSGDNPSISQIATLAGGSEVENDKKYGDNDNRVVTGEGNMYSPHSSVLEVIKKLQSETQKKPYCLVISLLNPHDVSLYPEGWEAVGYKESDFVGPNTTSIVLPESYTDSLTGKPTVQAAYLNTSFKGKLLDTPETPYATNYLKFYAFLHTLSDKLLGSVMDSLTPETLKSTILIRMADHGEMGMSHGGLQEKNFSMYNEMIRVPMIWMNPAIKSGPRPQLVSLIDLVPTIGTLIGGDLTKYPSLQGQDYSNALFNPDSKGQDALLFNYNVGTASGCPSDTETIPSIQDSSKEMYQKNPNAPSGTTPSDYPNNIYAIIRKDYKFAIYYSLDKNNKVDWNTAQYEKYSLKGDDPFEMTNLIPVPASGNSYTKSQLKDITNHYSELTILMKMKGIVGSNGTLLPDGWSDFKVPS